MPDDTIPEEEEFAEQNEEGSTGFDEEDDATPEDDDVGKTTEKEDEDLDPTDTSEETEDDDAETDTDDDEPEKEDKPEPTAKERAEARAALIDEEPPDVEDAKQPTTKTPPDPTPPTGQGGLTKEKIAEYLGSVDMESLPDEMIIGDNVINLKEMKEVEPDTLNTIVVMANIIADKRDKSTREELDKRGYVPKEEVEKIESNFNERLEQLQFEMDLRDIKGDFKKKTNTPEFADWLNNQSPKIQRLATMRDVQSASDVLDYFDEDMAKKAVSAVDKKAKEKKDKHDAIHKDTIRSDKRSGSPKDVATETKDDAESGFEEEDENDRY